MNIIDFYSDENGNIQKTIRLALSNIETFSLEPFKLPNNIYETINNVTK